MTIKNKDVVNVNDKGLLINYHFGGLQANTNKPNIQRLRLTKRTYLLTEHTQWRGTEAIPVDIFLQRSNSFRQVC